MLSLHGVPTQGAILDRPDPPERHTQPPRQWPNADKMRDEHHRKGMLPSGLPASDQPRGHFSDVPRTGPYCSGARPPESRSVPWLS
jgi:hypothetical protein